MGLKKKTILSNKTQKNLLDGGRFDNLEKNL